MKYRYTAFDKSGRSVRDTVEAPDKSEATELVRKRGLFVTEMTEAGRRETSAPAARRGSVRLKDLANFSRQMAVLVSTGTPLVEAMEALERQSPEGPWREVVADVRKRVEEGKQLSEAMEAHPDVFDGICRSLVAAGESGGKLDAMLERLARLTRQQQKVRSSLVGAMVYPCLLIVVGLVVMCVMIGFVMPRFEGLFKTLGAPLPPSTEALMAGGEFLRGYWWAVAGGIGFGAAGLKFWLASPSGRLFMDGLLVGLPQVGKVTRSFATARVARVLGVLLEGKVALLDALRLTRQATGNTRYAALIERVEDAVTRGESVSAALGAPASEGPNLISPAVCEAVRSGEKTGQIGPVLLSVAEAMDEDNEVLMKSLTSLIEPLILVGLGVMVGVVAISMFLPLFDLTAAGGAMGPAGGDGP